jgi:hypothetical protein
MPVDSTPERNLIAAILERALLDLRSKRTRGAALWWLTDGHGTCPSYCYALDIAYDRFRPFVRERMAVIMSKPQGQRRSAR